ncbi:isochorismatase family cysteine hydrolase [Nitrospirillum sp. BR 11163]|uniref:cysteine hydrolase family protein n=1 Tax=Nitrospirillum sp. BR 11163 TaxID=3104323 RepID=UPI002AFE36E1|nr:isochorismatase family cysteine hydrolase [Nitrospirillum sp. BR 11163]MEA1673612.1 isochorismatase family cysteine hydrolase [Nitrospirillum sp. BR 11163]
MDWMPTPATVHLCLDMQRLFSPEHPAGPWPTPWLPRILPMVAAIAERFPARTIFTRFIPPRTPGTMPGTWRPYYERWRHATRAHLPPDTMELLAPLARLCPPAIVVDKPVYSAFIRSTLASLLRQRRADGLVVTGCETDVCVLATVLDAIDLGYPVCVVTDAVCSSVDASHDAVLTLYRTRFAQQVITLTTEELLNGWPGD